ncbi:beta-lactamase [Streptomyces subrutilus]|uniref:Beta-lactamase n=1 Tax=Streptomyces subrutilus TaxID=36818 RepID=A0A5P2UM90_9ACTN|nr:serine hydrolase domain-containing protein [Streptomyces subrutilus]QEU79519.1 class A beta-lactamase-related serine hydrolase [Streptomyces subrutilus]GGZ82801.1 beta-lactamase [Streptomyces subrutilus]
MAARWRDAAVAAAAAGLLVTSLGAWEVPAATTAAVAAATPAAGDFPQLTPAVARQLDAAVRKVMERAGVPGVMVSVSAPGKGEYVRSFGVADKATGAAMDTGLNMRIGSETKTFTVTALLRLVDAGKVGLDDPIGTYVAGVPNGDKITLRELAGMRSGLFNYSADPAFFKALTGDPQRQFTPRELLAYSFAHPVQFAPGAQFEYCNTNLVLLGLVVEKVSGTSLGAYLAREVVGPAGLTHTLLPEGAEFPDPHAHGYTRQTASGKTEDATDWNPSWAWAAGAMVSDLADLRSWAKTLATGTLLTPATQAQRLKIVPAGNLPETGYGLGIAEVGGWIGHNGSLPGYQSLTVYLPEARATLVVLLNTDTGYQGQEPSSLFGEAITRIVTPDHVFLLPAQQPAEKR